MVFDIIQAWNPCPWTAPPLRFDPIFTRAKAMKRVLKRLLAAYGGNKSAAGGP